MFKLEGPSCTADELFRKFALAIAGAFDDEEFEIGKVVLSKHMPYSDPWGMQEEHQFSVRVHLPNQRTEILWYIKLATKELRLRWANDAVVSMIRDLCADITRNVPEVVEALRFSRMPEPHGLANPLFYEPGNPHPDGSILGVLWKCERLP